MGRSACLRSGPFIVSQDPQQLGKNNFTYLPILASTPALQLLNAIAHLNAVILIEFTNRDYGP